MIYVMGFKKKVVYFYLFIFRGWGGDILVLMILLNDEIVVNFFLVI